MFKEFDECMKNGELLWFTDPEGRVYFSEEADRISYKDDKWIILWSDAEVTVSEGENGNTKEEWKMVLSMELTV